MKNRMVRLYLCVLRIMYYLSVYIEIKNNNNNHGSNGDIRVGAKFDVGGGVETSFPISLTYVLLFKAFCKMKFNI